VDDGVRGDDGHVPGTAEDCDPRDHQAQHRGDRQNPGQPGGERYRGDSSGDQRQPGAEPDVDHDERHDDGQQTGDGQDRRRRGLQVLAVV
jgi:hypothetical protein